ncbi:unnamed protein product, partial [Phaeothamnion confervicola]
MEDDWEAWEEGDEGDGSDGDEGDGDEGDGGHEEPPTGIPSGEVVVEMEVDTAAGENAVGSAAAGDGAAAPKKPKKKPVRISKEDKAAAVDIHRAHVSALVARALLCNGWASDPEVHAAAYSCLSAEIIEAHEAGVLGTVAGVRRLVQWFRAAFQVLDGDDATDDEGGAGSRPARLLQVVEQRAGSSHEAAQVFVALCRSLGLHTRYVACLDVPSCKATATALAMAPKRRTRRHHSGFGSFYSGDGSSSGDGGRAQVVNLTGEDGEASSSQEGGKGNAS